MDQRPAKPRETRISVSYEGVLTTADGHEVTVVVRDVSASGFRIELAEELLEGELVQMRIGKQATIAAEIKWALGGEAGGVFLEPLELSRLG